MTLQRVMVRRETDAAPHVERILRNLEEWFGIEEAVIGYIAAARELPAFSAIVGDEVVGICLVKRHNARAAEIHLMAVDRTSRRAGIGRALISAVEDDLAGDGVEFLQVKTLGPSEPSPEYTETRLFYEAMGFVPLEELDGIWENNPCLIMIKHIARD
jgi:GNAT superfamily N-acetyltransferase